MDDKSGFGVEADDTLRKLVDDAFANADEDSSEDTGGFDAPLTNAEVGLIETIKEEDAKDVLAENQPAPEPKVKESKPVNDDKAKKDDKPAEEAGKPKEDSKAEADHDTEKKDDNEPGDDPATKPEEPTVDLQKADSDDLLNGLSADQKAEVKRRLGAANEAMKPFEDAYIQGQMSSHGASAKQVATRLVELAKFAAQKPDEYIAWAVSESATPEKQLDLIKKAAGHLGLKVVKDDDADLFDEPEEPQSPPQPQPQNAQPQQLNFGPDSPQNLQARQEQALQSFINEPNADGTGLKRPYWSQFERQITAKAQQHVQAKKTAATFADLDRFYDEAMEEMRAALGVPATPAAQNTPPVQKQQTEADAAAVEKAKAAGRTLSGSGDKGRSKAPSIPVDAPLKDVIGGIWDQLAPPS